MDLNHFHLQAKDVQKTKLFYESYFEFKEIFSNENKVYLLNRDGFTLGLDKPERQEPLPAWFHFGFSVDSQAQLRSLYQRMSMNGVVMLGGLNLADDPMNFYCKDPDGNTIEVYFKAGSEGSSDPSPSRPAI